MGLPVDLEQLMSRHIMALIVVQWNARSIYKKTTRTQAIPIGATSAARRNFHSRNLPYGQV